jgi:hypothetical protein
MRKPKNPVVAAKLKAFNEEYGNDPNEPVTAVADRVAAPKASSCRKRIGLVLEGGGAKGAFQFGCLKALNEADIIFDAVAGTSVGALNGALWCTNQMMWGEKFWNTISFAKVYPLRRPYFFFLPIATLYAALRFIFNWVGRFPLINLLVLTLIFMLGCLPGCYVVVSLPVRLFLLIRDGSAQISPSELTIWMMAAVVLGPILFVKCVEHFDLSAFTALPLRSTLTSRIENRPFRCPLFATTAKLAEVYDPDNLVYVSTGIPPSAAILMPHPVKKYIPRYWQLDMDPRSVSMRLLASAALPFGIVPAVEGHVDGGVADNLPIYPTVSLVSCEKIIVIRANAGIQTDDELRNHWRRCDRLLRIAKYRSADAHEANPKQMPLYTFERVPPPRSGPAEPEAEIVVWPATYTIECPLSKTWWLWDLITKTMNFRPRFTKPLLLAGYTVTKEKLASDLKAFIDAT